MLNISSIVVKQSDTKECGVCALLSIIRYYNGNVSKEKLSYILKENMYGINAYNLINGAKEIGFDAYAYKEDFNEFIKNNKTLPVIVHTTVNKLDHYIVVYKINNKNKKILVMDPAKGKVKYSFNYFKSIYNGIVISFYPVKRLPLFNDKNELLSLILNTIKIIKYESIIILSLFVIIFTIINSFYFKIIIDYVIVYKSIYYLLLVSITFVLLIFIKNIIEYIKENFLINANYILSSNINNYTISHILRLPYHYFKVKPTGDIITRLDDLEEIKELISKTLPNIVISLLIITISLIVLILINIKLFIICFIFSLLYILLGILFSIIFKNKIKEVQENNSEYNSYLVECIENYESIKNLNIINKINRLIERKYYDFLNNNILLHKLINKNNYIKNTFDDLSFIITLSIGALFVINDNITIGSLITFLSIMSFYLEPLKSVLLSLPSISFVKSSYERINDILKYTSEDNKYTNKKIHGKITIKNISYSFNNVDYIFQNETFEIKKNSFTLIEGVSGIGKSTFIKILKKYINDYEGDILIDNYNLKDINKNILDNSFNYVSQNEMLFSGTIRENIEIVKKLSDKEYERIINITNVNTIIENKINRNNFYVEEGGFNLSGGEKQRIVLARALTRKFNYLIIDEALSEVDLNTTIDILIKLKNYYKNKTIICISHNEDIKKLFKERIKF